MPSRIRSSILAIAAIAAVSALTGQAHADFVVGPTTVSAASEAGTSITLTGGPYTASSVLTLSSTGTGNLNTDGGGPFLTNAAGVVIAAGSSYPGVAPGSTLTGPGGLPYGALLIGNATLGFFQVYPDTAANGFGSPTPTTTVNVSTTLGSIFGAGVSFANGTTLVFKVNDISGRYGDNSGSFSLAGSLISVPEPSSIAMLGLGAVGVVGYGVRRRRQVA